MSILNAGGVDPGPFATVLRIDGVMPPNGKVEAGRMAPGAAGDLCVEVALTPGPHQLTAFVDEPRGIDEVSDTNNRFDLPYVVSKVAGAQEPAPSPSPARADLIVTAIRVRDEVPDGKDDCKDGKNPVAVVVKNDGTANAGSFVVRITVDEIQGDDVQAYAVVESVDGLEAGKEREVRFAEVKLKKGQHALAAVADYKRAVAESTEGNNDREVTVRCQDDD
jgi:subtilase family serine protease